MKFPLNNQSISAVVGAVAITITVLMVSGCGQKGALYLTDTGPTEVSAPANSPDKASVEAPQDEKEKKTH